jgi:hypothetical protein
MSANDGPFSALDKMLFSPSPLRTKKGSTAKLRRRNAKSKKRPEKENLTPSVDQVGRPSQSTKSVDQSTRPVDRTSRPDQSGQSIQLIRPVDQSTRQLTGAVVKRPLAFYIPLTINEKIEEAVLYYRKKYNQKIDRSAVVSAILGNPRIWKKPSLDKLAGKVADQLRNRLNDRLSSRLDQSTQ